MSTIRTNPDTDGYLAETPLLVLAAKLQINIISAVYGVVWLPQNQGQAQFHRVERRENASLWMSDKLLVLKGW